MDHNLVTVVLGLAASLSWGGGDFSGGLATRKSSVLTVVVAAHATGLLLLIALALGTSEHFPPSSDLIWGVLAGFIGAIGLVAFYRALSVGRMGIIAPTTAVLAATLPVIASVFRDGLPNIFQTIGFVLAIFAVLLISRPEGVKGRPQGLGLAILAGFGFGGFFILISQVHSSGVYWPLSAARLSSFLFMLSILLLRRQPILPKRSAIPLMLLAGVLDVAGNAFFVMATHSGRLDVSTILSSLYPAITVLLARLVLKEHVNRLQAIGVLVALVAVPLISL